MYKKFFQITFIFSFILLLIIPIATINLHKNTISTPENRRLANRPRIFLKDDNKAPDALFNPKGDQEIFNKNFFREFETWINDNIGFRSFMVGLNVKIKYYIFKVFIIKSRLFSGPNNEINEMDDEMILNYQRLNLFSEKYLKEFATSLQTIKDYLASNGANFYYYQNWDKYTIYPESVNPSLKQFGKNSRTDEMLRALKQYTNINVISPKKDLINAKEKYRTYFRLTEPLHWTPRGARIGYRKLINSLNEKENTEFKVLNDDDYDILKSNNDWEYFQTINVSDEIERFYIKKKNSQIIPTTYFDDELNKLVTVRKNENAGNKIRVLLICDCYFDQFILDDIAESFYETIILPSDKMLNMKKAFDNTKPDIVILESAERMNRTPAIIQIANEIKEEKNQNDIKLAKNNPKNNKEIG